jgi:hypothetical protein
MKMSNTTKLVGQFGYNGRSCIPNYILINKTKNFKSRCKQIMEGKSGNKINKIQEDLSLMKRPSAIAMGTERTNGLIA